MKINILLFGIITDLLETSKLEIQVSKNITVADLKDKLLSKYSQLENIDSYSIAVNENYADDKLNLQENDIVAIIPPVSGG